MREAAALRAAGLALFNARKFPDAARAYQQSLALEPAHFDAHLMLGTIASLCAAPESAAAHYGAAIAADPGNAIAHMNLGLARSAMRDMTGALEAFERAGCEAWTCDLLPSRGRPDRHLQCDVWEVVNDAWELIRS